MKGYEKMSLSLSTVVFEVTRRCNMNCEHCLRGKAENMDLDTKYIDKFLENVDYIQNITFSGGEPSLNVAAINYTLQKCKELGIAVGGFYIVTNAKENTEELAIAALRWYGYCEDFEKEYTCGITVSRDMFHDDVNMDNIDVLRGLSFFRDDKTTDFNQVYLINEGRAEELSGFKKRDVSDEEEELICDINGEDGDVESLLYLCANGEIRNNCNTAFNNPYFTIGNLNENSLLDVLREASLVMA